MADYTEEENEEFIRDMIENKKLIGFMTLLERGINPTALMYSASELQYRKNLCEAFEKAKMEVTNGN